MTPLTSVLIVDDEPAVRDLMSRWVSALGLRAQTVASAAEALATLRTRQYDLAVIDVMMPGHDGLWLAHEVQRDHPHTAVVIATAYTELLDGEAQQQPVADFLIKPFQRERFALAVDRGRQWRKQTLEEMHWHALLSIELRDRAAEICGQVQERAANGETESDALLALAAERIPDTAEHGERVARYAHSVAREMGVLADLGEQLAIGARFHDIGKIAIPEALLTKPSPLTTGEKAIMRQHADVGAEILGSTLTLTDAAPIVLASHEWFGGGGYPWKLAGDEIPLASRIIAAVDAYDAMTQHRAYRVSLDSSDAVAELLRCCPGQFDPEVVGAFLAVLGRH
ncbi:MAG TPA: HD domain-containing phosphohydrolase [Vicinamibacterales bacterium]|nr:HD domain-containing phosphohydrolase [Vicinamibacterales bacterium]